MIKDFLGNGSSQPKITQLHLAVLIDKDISWFDIPMHDSRLMNQVNGTKDVVNYSDHVLFSKLHFIRHIKYLIHVLAFILHD